MTFVVPWAALSWQILPVTVDIDFYLTWRAVEKMKQKLSLIKLTDLGLLVQLR